MNIPVFVPLYNQFEQWQITSDGETVCGRAEQSDLRLDLESIAERHCRLVFKAGALTVHRMDGRLWVNDLPVSSHSALVPGDVLSVGPVSFQIDTASRPASTLNTPSHTRNALSSVTEERIANVEAKERALDLREQQIQQLNLVLLEREQTLTNRARGLDDRAGFLNEQKSEIGQLAQASEQLRLSIQKQTAELEQRRLQAIEQETQLAEKQQSSAAVHSHTEQSLAELRQRTEHLYRSESELETRNHVLSKLAAELDTTRSQLQADTAASAALLEAVRIREVAVQETVATVASREASASLAEQRMAEAEAKWHTAAALEETVNTQLEKLNEQSACDERQRQQIESEWSELKAQRQQLAEQMTSLNQRTSKLQTLETEAARQKAEVDENGSRVTRSVEQLTAIATERESAARTREEAQSAIKELNASRAALAAEKSKLELFATSLQEWQSRLETEDARINEDRADFANAQTRLQKDRNQFKSECETFATQHTSFETTQTRFLDEQSNFEIARASLIDERLHLEHQLAQLHEKRAELESLQTSFAGQQTVFADHQSELAELQRVASVALRNAETEREALHSSHKDLICERNSLTQSSQDLQSRAAGLAEREAIVVQQTEELRSRFYALTQQDSELQKTEAELNSRAADLHRRLLLFKEEISVSGSRTPQTGEVSDEVAAFASAKEGSQAGGLAQALAESEAQRALMADERDNLMIAIRELQKAMLNARADVEEASRIRNEAAQHEQTLAELYQTIEERSGHLQLMESLLRRAEEDTGKLNAQITEMSRMLENRTDKNQFTSASDPETENDSQELEILGQLNLLRDSLGSSNGKRPNQQPSANSGSDDIVQQLRREIEELRGEVSTAGTVRDGEQPINLAQVDELRVQIERLEVVLRDRDDLIRELRSRLQQQIQQPAESSDIEGDLQREADSRELDRRVQLLDEREKELIERQRRVTHSEGDVEAQRRQLLEGDVEAQRRQLLEARQQLEIARAEVQVAIWQHTTVAAAQSCAEPQAIFVSGKSDSSDSLDMADYSNDGSVTSLTDVPQSEFDEADASHDLRAELANLFGVRKAASEPVQPVQEIRTQPVEFVDLSEPAGDARAVEFRFGDNTAEIVGRNTLECSPEDSEAANREENSDDFVRDYMEQLLTRSRKGAGNSLPAELKPNQSAGPGPQTPQRQPQKKNEAPAAPRGQRSFIDQYMAGGFPELDAAASAVPPAESTPVTVSPGPVIPRAKVDLQKLRENMDSFRSVSAQSAENALVNHAMRTERVSINGRIMLTFVMAFMTVFVAIANTKGIINHPSAIWITLLGAVAAGAELVRKWCSVRSRCKVAISPESSEHFRKSASTNDANSKLATAEITEARPDVPPVNSGLQDAADKPQLDRGPILPEQEEIGRMESDRSEYFEL